MGVGGPATPDEDPHSGMHDRNPRLQGSGPWCGSEKEYAVQLTEADAVRRVAMISEHTSPLA